MNYVSVDVDLDDIINSMSTTELQDLVDDLYADGYTPTELAEEESKKTLQENEFLIALGVLKKNRYNLSIEEEEYILKLVKRF